MKVLTAAAGDRADDFSATVPGEVVFLGVVCGRDEQGDGGCGCGRSFTGLSTGLATTVAVVADLELDMDDLAELTGDRGYAEEIAADAAEWPAGTRLRRVQPDDELVPE